MAEGLTPICTDDTDLMQQQNLLISEFPMPGFVRFQSV
jgi:hypothetical protein